MPSSQASKGKKGNSRSRDSRSLSRATSPLSVATAAAAAAVAVAPSSTSVPLALASASTSPTDSSYLHTPLASLLVPSDITIESLIERHSPNSSNPPSAASLHALHDDIANRVLSHVRTRGEVCDKGMRELSRKRKDRIEEDRAREERERDDERRKRDKERQKAAAAKATATATAAAAATAMAKKRENTDGDLYNQESRPPTVGAHGLARQDGVHTDQSVDAEAATSPQPQTAAASYTGNNEAVSPSASDTSHQPLPAPAVAHYETFGEDPTKFDDPTVYHIRDLTPEMTDDEKKLILCVARYPHDDLHDKTPGTPPDMDFSNAKPPNQINYTTFQAYVEPYIRPLTEEDVAFLKERGDPATPYLIPARGPTPYRELWAKEDGLSHHDFNPRLPPNEARGSIENMTDDLAETDEISNGPVIARLLQSLRHEPNTFNNNDAAAQQSGDVAMVNGDATAGAHDVDLPALHAVPTNEDDTVATFKPSTHFPELSGTATYKSPSSSSRDLASLDQRILQELRYSGFLTPEASPDYDSHFDDEIAARLRHLQSELKHISRENGARKARVLELTEERMAMQEYSTIADDLDSQINTAYLKRNRTMSKPKKGVGKARPGQAGTGGVAISRNTVSEGVRMLMDRRKEWRDLIGPVVDYGQTSIPRGTVFDKSTMERLDKAEAEARDAEGD